jgi:hypothetical protein
MAKVFISYAHEDRDRVKIIADALRGLGHTVWTDNELLVGDNWDEVIQRKILETDAFILALSQDYLQSQYAKDEKTFANRHQKPILPIRLDNTEPSTTLITNARQTIDASNKDAINKSIEELDQRLNEIAPPAPPEKPPQQPQPPKPPYRFSSEIWVGIIALVVTIILAFLTANPCTPGGDILCGVGYSNACCPIPTPTPIISPTPIATKDTSNGGTTAPVAPITRTSLPLPTNTLTPTVSSSTPTVVVPVWTMANVVVDETYLQNWAIDNNRVPDPALNKQAQDHLQRLRDFGRNPLSTEQANGFPILQPTALAAIDIALGQPAKIIVLYTQGGQADVTQFQTELARQGDLNAYTRFGYAYQYAESTNIAFIVIIFTQN